MIAASLESHVASRPRGERGGHGVSRRSGCAVLRASPRSVLDDLLEPARLLDPAGDLGLARDATDDPGTGGAKSRAHGWSAQRPIAARSQTIPVAIASQPQSPTCSKAGRSPRAPNQSKPTTRRPDAEECGRTVPRCSGAPDGLPGLRPRPRWPGRACEVSPERGQDLSQASSSHFVRTTRDGRWPMAGSPGTDGLALARAGRRRGAARGHRAGNGPLREVASSRQRRRLVMWRPQERRGHDHSSNLVHRRTMVTRGA